MPPTDEPTARQAHRLLQELKIHQIELEMQNEQLRKSQAELEASRARFVDLYDFAPVGYCTVSAAGLIVEINLTASTMLGVSRCKMIGRRLADFIFPDDQDLYFNHRHQLKGDGPQLKLELRLTGSGKLFFWACLEVAVAKDDQGASVYRYVLSEISSRKQMEEGLQKAHSLLEHRVVERTRELTITNQALTEEITERAEIEKTLRINRDLHALLSTCTIALLDSEDRKTIVESLCRSAVECGYFKLAWVGLPDSPRQMYILSAAGPAMGYLEGITISRDRTKLSGQSPAVICLETNLSVINDDFSTNPSLIPCRERAQTHGLGSSAAFPIRQEGRCIGALSLYAGEPGFFTQDRVLLLEQLVANLSTAFDLLQKRRQARAMHESLHLSEQRYRIVADNTYDWAFWVDPQGTYVYVSPACATISGYAAEQFMADAALMRNIIYPEDRAQFDEHIHCSGEKKGPATLFFRIHRKDRQVRWIEHLCQAVFDAQGGYLGYRGSNRDITEQKMVEKALVDSQERYQRITMALTDCIYTVYLRGNTSGQMLYSPGCEKVTGYTPADFAADTTLWLRIVDEKFREAVQIWSANVLGQMTTSSIVVQIVCKDGRRRWVRNTLVPFFDDQGELAQFDGLVQDITELKQSENQILQSKKRLQAVFDGMSEPLIMVDKDLSVKMLNLAAAQYYRLASLTEAIGKSCCRTLGEKNDCVDCRIPSAVAGEKLVTFSRRGHSDRERYESVTVFPIIAEKREDSGAVIRISDITEAKMMEKMLIRTEKLASIGVLSAGVAHEINNPNNFIMFNIPVLRRYLGEMLPIVRGHAAGLGASFFFGMSYEDFEKDLFELIDSIENGSERIKKIVAELKQFSSPEEEDQTERVHPEKLIGQALRLAHVHLKDTVKRVEVQVPPGLPDILFETGRLEQVLVNLMINAAQAMDKADSWLCIRARAEGEAETFLVIEIEDNGCGMDEDGLEKVFDLFYTTKAPGIGTGLGLYVCHNLIDKAGGRLTVTSRVGQGSIFSVRLPYKK